MQEANLAAAALGTEQPVTVVQKRRSRKLADPVIVEKLYLNEREVSARYGVGVRQLRMMRLRNKGPRYIKVSGGLGKRGSRVLYPSADVDAWLAGCPAGGGRPT